MLSSGSITNFAINLRLTQTFNLQCMVIGPQHVHICLLPAPTVRICLGFSVLIKSNVLQEIHTISTLIYRPVFL